MFPSIWTPLVQGGAGGAAAIGLLLSPIIAFFTAVGTVALVLLGIGLAGPYLALAATSAKARAFPLWWALLLLPLNFLVSMDAATAGSTWWALGVLLCSHFAVAVVAFFHAGWRLLLFLAASESVRGQSAGGAVRWYYRAVLALGAIVALAVQAFFGGAGTWPVFLSILLPGVLALAGTSDWSGTQVLPRARDRAAWLLGACLLVLAGCSAAVLAPDLLLDPNLSAIRRIGALLAFAGGLMLVATRAHRRATANRWASGAIIAAGVTNWLIAVGHSGIASEDAFGALSGMVFYVPVAYLLWPRTSAHEDKTAIPEPTLSAG